MNIYDKLNQQQKKGVFTTEGPVLILAGAGSGKTGVITHRIAYLINEMQINPYNILAITFTNKAAAEMRERVDNIAGIDAGAAWIMTFHAACIRILRRFIDRIGYGTNFTIYDTDDQKTVIKEVIKKMNLDPKQYKERSILSLISNAKDNMQSPDDMYRESCGKFSLMKTAEIYREYQERMQKNNAVDFDDIICLTVKLFELEPEVLEYYRERFKYIMVDEYQDTNLAQFTLIKHLAGRTGNLCVVGDDDQSIYKFRGANINNILDFEKNFNDAVIIKLEQNYRSTGNILDVANAVISNNQSRKNKSLWTDRENGDKTAFNLYENGYEEAKGIAEDIFHKVSEEGNAEYRDFAILYRTNAQSRILEEKLLEKNIPYKIYGGINFYGRKEIKDILAYLKTIDNARDDLAVRRILNVPKRGIGAASMDKIQDFAYMEDITFYEALKRSSEIPSLKRTQSKINSFVSDIETLRSEIKKMGVADLIKKTIEITRYDEYLDNECDTPEESDDRKSNIDEIISKAVLYEEAEDAPDLRGFLEEVALVADIDSLDDSLDSVSLMTIHSAKGLEFTTVYLTGMEDGLFPGYMSISTGDEEDIEEERRLCYVGVTRAKTRLVMSAAKLRVIRGETHLNRISRFVKEIPRELLIESGQSGNRNSLRNDSVRNENVTGKYGQAAFTSFQREKLRMDIFDKKSGQASGGKPDYDIGDRVTHTKFGDGKVIDMKDGGRDYEVTVDFDTAGVKKMFAGFAKLSKI